MRVAVFLPVKGQSERIENKNTRLLDGQPLFLLTLSKLINCGLFDEVWLDSESETIHALASEYDCRHHYRDPALASNQTDGNRLFLNEVHQTQADIVVQVLCTSPFIRPETLAAGLKVLKSDQSFDSVVLVRRDKCYLWGPEGPLYDFQHIPNSVDLPETTIETMGLYMVRRQAALELRRRIGNSPFMLPASPMEAVDLNNPEDLELAQCLSAGLRERNNRRHRLLQRHLSSALLSDILDDLGHEGIVGGLRPNLPASRVLGRAKTLHLRALEPDEDYMGIYDALASYRHLVPGDFIAVQNDLPDYAYFGELNANMALEAGAVGAIIGGMTRDSAATSHLGFPVFAAGTGCADVRKRATLASHGRRIVINGVEIKDGDLLFADAEGVVVIPQKLENAVLSRAVESIGRERAILTAILSDVDKEHLFSKFGGF